MLKEKLEFNLDFLKPSTPPLVGVDISSSAVKMVELAKPAKDKYRVERYVIEPMPSDAVVEGNIVNLEATGDAVKRAWKRLGTRVKNVALAVPFSASITKKIVVPAGQREEELEVMVESEANQYIPFSLDEVNLDFQVLGPAPGSPEEEELLIAASRKEKVEDRIASAQAAGLKAVVMDIEPYAAMAALELMLPHLADVEPDQLLAIVDIGATNTSINVLRNGQSVYMRDQTFGGNQLTQQIQAQYGLSAEEAEAAKRSGGLPESYETDVLAPFRETLALEVARALQFFFTSSQYNEVNHVVLAGGCAALPGLDEIVTARTQVRSVVANPFAGMELSSRIRPVQLSADAPSLMVACGLALRRFDPA
ncbi:MAG TPA: pilus assembly protein PilM [Pelomicrobium sp.]|nr:pilus assembly protein PilM [Pelomicrobium sp.]